MPLHSVDSRSRVSKDEFRYSPKITLVTDIADVRTIPRAILAMVRDERRIVRNLELWSKSKSDSDACLVWLDGDRLLEGNTRDLLKRLHSADRRSFVVVNTPCVEQAPFLTIQPRIFAGAAATDYRSFRIRIESSSAPSTRILINSDKPPEAWAQLASAISRETAKAGSGVEPLLQLWEMRDKLPDVIGALVSRNLVAAMLRHDGGANARKFLEAGAKLFPTYAEVHYLAALLAVREHRFGEAVSFIERAKSCGVAFPGSGGENSYRCDWLLGVIAARVGDDRVAFERFLSGVKHNPVFEPSLEELLKLRLPRSVIEKHQYALTQAVRWKPHLAPKIFEFLLAHRASDAARRIPQTVRLEPAQRESMAHQLASVVAPHRSGVGAAVDQKLRDDSKQTPGIALEGPFFEHSSLARVNREIAHALLASHEFGVRLEPSAPAALPLHLFPEEKVIAAVHAGLPQTHLTIRHRWPPDFRRPPEGKLAVILPWEYAGVPNVWIEQIQENVDELWVPSNFVREVLVRNGVDAARVVVIPNGYDPKLFRPMGPSYLPHGCRGFVFLFVGGAIPRKGIDLLLEAYQSAFEPSQDVTLVLLVSDSSGAYQHNSRIAEIKASAADPERGYVIPISESISDSALADLYRGAHAFVLPYRGEGFGMPLLEAMACGKPVITTAEGPSKDFCDDSNSYLIPATIESVPDQPPPLGPMASPFAWYEPDLAQLVKTLRHIYDNPAEAAAKGRAAANATRHLTWESAAHRYAERIRQLCKSQ